MFGDRPDVDVAILADPRTQTGQGVTRDAAEHGPIGAVLRSMARAEEAARAVEPRDQAAHVCAGCGEGVDGAAVARVDQKPFDRAHAEADGLSGADAARTVPRVRPLAAVRRYQRRPEPLAHLLQVTVVLAPLVGFLGTHTRAHGCARARAHHETGDPGDQASKQATPREAGCRG